jgi:hypothetical protein
MLRSPAEIAASATAPARVFDETLVRFVASEDQPPAATGLISSESATANAGRVRVTGSGGRPHVGAPALSARGDQQQTPEEHRERRPADHAIHQQAHPARH